jgi:Leu/Phe-tRNA-protein transferase
VASDHLASLGAREVSRSQFVALLRRFAQRIPCGSWRAPPPVPAPLRTP